MNQLNLTPELMKLRLSALNDYSKQEITNQGYKCILDLTLKVDYSYSYLI